MDSKIKSQKDVGSQKNNSPISGGRNITMYNVKFGDCFVISENSDCMLVDFGSIVSINRTTQNKVINCLSNYSRIFCLLTHFHQDHYRGINLLANSGSGIIFDKVYIPNVFSNRKSLELMFWQLLLLAKNDRNHVYILNAIMSPVHFSKLMTPSSKIRLISQGATFYLGNTEYEVLAPLPNSLFDESNDFEKTLMYMFSDNQEISHITEQIQAIVNRLTDSIDEDENNLYMNLSRLEPNTYQQKVNSLISEFDSFSKEYRKSFERYKNVFSKLNTNDASIVFRSTDAKILMTGDMTPSVWDKIKDKFNQDDYYNIVKIPHHGTKAHFVSDLPSAKSFFISCGESGHPTWEITKRYYCGYRNVEFKCSNYNHCEAYQNKICQFSCTSCDENNNCPVPDEYTEQF